MKTKNCPNCGNKVSTTSKFCKFCGTNLSAPISRGESAKCPVCGKVFPKKEELCPSCFGFMSGKSRAEKATFAEMIKNPELAGMVRKMMNTSIEDMIGDMVGSKAKDFMEDYVKTDDGKKMMQIFQ